MRPPRGERCGFDDVSPESLQRRETAKWGPYGPGVIAAAAAEMDFATAPPVLRAIADAVEREEFGYAHPRLASNLAQAVASWQHSAHGWIIDPQLVHVLPDALRGVELAVEFWGRPGCPVLVPTPAYMPFFEIPPLLQRHTLEAPLAVRGDRYVLDLDAIDAGFGRGAGVLLLCHPHNPVGRSFDRSELLELSAVVSRHGARVVSDEIHAPLTYGRAHVPYASVNEESAAHTVTITSASKAWNIAGLKCAQLITGSPDDEARWHHIPPRRTKGASTIGMRASVAAFAEGGPWLRKVRTYLDGNRHLLGTLLDRHLPEVGYRIPEATYFAWLDCRALGLEVEPARFFLDHAGVALSPGGPFGGSAAGFVRLNFATSRALLESAIASMGAASGRQVP